MRETSDAAIADVLAALRNLNVSDSISVSDCERKLEVAYASMREEIAIGLAVGVEAVALKSKISRRVVQSYKLVEEVAELCNFWKKLVQYSDTKDAGDLYSFVSELKSYPCCVCLDESVLGLVFCQTCDGGVVCHGCMPDVIKNWCSNDSAGDRLYSCGEVMWRIMEACFVSIYGLV